MSMLMYFILNRTLHVSSKKNFLIFTWKFKMPHPVANVSKISIFLSEWHVKYVSKNSLFQTMSCVGTQYKPITLINSGLDKKKHVEEYRYR